MSIYTDIAAFTIPIIAGGLLIAFANTKSKQLAKLEGEGLRAEGIVFELDEGPEEPVIRVGGDREGWESNGKTPVVRFVTAGKEWITARPSYATHNLYKAGQAVTVIYSKDDPADFFIESKLNHILYPVLQALGGLLLVAGGVIFVWKLL